MDIMYGDTSVQVAVKLRPMVPVGLAEANVYKTATERKRDNCTIATSTGQTGAIFATPQPLKSSAPILSIGRWQIHCLHSELCQSRPSTGSSTALQGSTCMAGRLLSQMKRPAHTVMDSGPVTVSSKRLQLGQAACSPEITLTALQLPSPPQRLSARVE